MTDAKNRYQAVLSHRLFWPVAVLVVLLAANTVYRPGFLSIEVNNGHLYGTPIDILRLSAPLILVVIGIGLQLLNPQLVRRFLDAAETGQELDVLVRTAVLFTANVRKVRAPSGSCMRRFTTKCSRR